MNNNIPITDADIQAYIDNRLSADRRLTVQRWLEIHPEDMRRVTADIELNQRLHQLFDPVMQEPVPTPMLSLPEVKSSQRLGVRRQWMPYALAGCMALVGVSIGWSAKGFLSTGDDNELIAHLAKPAAFAHYVYSTDNTRPVEMKSSDEKSLIKWLSLRLKTKIQAPDFSALGYSLIGGRLLPSTNRMAAQFMYQHSDGTRVTVYVRRVTEILGKASGKSKVTEYMWSSHHGINTYYWTAGGLGYAVNGVSDRDLLLQVVRSTKQQLQI